MIAAMSDSRWMMKTSCTLTTKFPVRPVSLDTYTFRQNIVINIINYPLKTYFI